MSEHVRVGIIGTGGMGARHARNLAREVAGARVVALVDPDQAQLAATAAETGAELAFDESLELIAHRDVDAVLIAAPDQYHADLARVCVEAGKPVLCEKPLATNAADAHEVIEAEVETQTRLVQLGFMREYDPAHVEVKRLVDSGEIGRPLAFRGVHVNPTKNALRTIEEVFSNSVVHDIHSSRWMLGEDIVEVLASTIPGAPERPDTARFALVHMRFAGGALGTIECNSESGYGYEVDVRITAEMGSVESASLRQPWVSHGGSRGQRVESDWLQRFDTAYVAEARAWIESVARGAPTGPSAWDGYVAMLVADACSESARSGRPVRVELPEMPPIYART
jgi:myo-inositol 2-dehydrogenase/D-chiro-inositol 1-dehydrogenase